MVARGRVLVLVLERADADAAELPALLLRSMVLVLSACV
jgi:hypothetical protein